MSTFFVLISMLNVAHLHSGGDLQTITAAIYKFAAAADDQDVVKMEDALHADFRVVANQLFGSQEISLIDRSTYLDLLKAGKLGGDKREVIIHTITIEGNNAIAKVRLIGSKLEFLSFIQLAKDANGKWTVIGDTPSIKEQ